MWDLLKKRSTTSSTPEIFDQLVEIESRGTILWKEFEQTLEKIDFESRSHTTNGRADLIRLWEAEFAYRGLGPLEARTKSENEIKVVQALRQAFLYYKSYIRDINSIVSNERYNRRKTLRSRATYSSLALLGLSIYFYFYGDKQLSYFTIAGLILVIAGSSVASHQIHNLSEQRIPPRKLIRMREPAQIRVAQQLKTIAEQLVDLDKSELFDDSQMRALILDWSYKN